MRWSILILWSLISTSWFIGCAYQTQKFAQEVQIKQKPIFSEFREIYKEGHSWEGVPEEDKKAMIELREKQITECEELVAEKAK